MTYFPILRLGMQHPEVATLRALLSSHGFKINEAAYNPNFTQAVSDAVYQFQARTGALTVDGIVGRNTWAALLRVSPSQITTSLPGGTTPTIPAEPVPVASKFSWGKAFGFGLAAVALFKIFG